MDPKSLMLVAAGGAIGAVLRYSISELSVTEYPWGTFAVNLSGSLILGCLLAFSIIGDNISPQTLLFVGTGIIGAFTTMSTFSIEVVQMFEAGEQSSAFGYMVANMVGCPLLAFTGWRMVASFLG